MPKSCKTPPKGISKEDIPYWKFFCSILSHGRLTQAYQDHLLTKYMVNFKTSVTHLSMTNNIVTSLEYYERIGDTVVNMCVNWWIVAKFPKMVDIDFTTKLLSAFKGTKYLGVIALDKGWGDVMMFDPKIIKRLDMLARKTKSFTATKEHPEGDYRTMSGYLKIYEDGLEAFFGCLVKTMEDDGQSFGTAIQVAYTIFFWMADSTYFNGPDQDPGMASVINDVDPATDLRNLYQNNDEIGWTIEGAVSYDRIPAHIEDGQSIPEKSRAIVYHWDGVVPERPYKDVNGVKVHTGNAKKYYNKDNRKILFIGEWSFDDNLAKASAAKKALELLANQTYYEYDSQKRFLGAKKLSKKYVMKYPVDPTDPYKEWTDIYYTHFISKELEQMKEEKNPKPKFNPAFNRGQKFPNQQTKTKTLTVGK